ncbi:hypothetical protein [Heyndrickxia camelliae]|uniref:Uncharacterized protein n=1 Tax=Heyndrickxia camelliae TaxID=1707093 RepID=A0A2N3LE45_9BACI|nr:hypothetical protein [Heyndrickxia camelliae]PKR82881.1 hypothetical protein CWO92_22080 [Heyndrickxia camelliae]
MNKKELIEQMRKVGQTIGVNAVQDFLESHDLEMDDIELSFQVKDKSKVNWKPKSKFVKVFDTELNKTMENKKIDIEMIGFLTVLSSYLNYEDNCLIKSDGTYLNQNDIVQLTGWNRKKVNQTIKTLIENEILYTEQNENDKRNKKYYIDPSLFFRGQKITKEVKEFFNSKHNLNN